MANQPMPKSRFSLPRRCDRAASPSSSSSAWHVQCTFAGNITWIIEYALDQCIGFRERADCLALESATNGWRRMVLELALARFRLPGSSRHWLALGRGRQAMEDWCWPSEKSTYPSPWTKDTFVETFLTRECFFKEKVFFPHPGHHTSRSSFRFNKLIVGIFQMPGLMWWRRSRW